MNVDEENWKGVFGICWCASKDGVVLVGMRVRMRRDEMRGADNTMQMQKHRGKELGSKEVGWW